MSSRNLEIDLLRALAIFGVVLIHTLNYLVNIKSNHYQPYFELSGIFRFAVPFFIIISGYFADKLNFLNFFRFFQKIILKLLFPFLIVSTISYKLFWGEWNTGVYWKVLLNGSADYGLWYIPLIILIYCIYWISHKLFRGFTLWFWTIIGVASLVACFIPLTTDKIIEFLKNQSLFSKYQPPINYLNNLLVSYTKELAQIQFYLVYFAIGMYIQKYQNSLFNNKKFTFIAGLIGTGLFSYFYYQDFLNFSFVQRFSYFNGYLALYAIFLFPLLYLVFQKISSRKSKIMQSVNLLGQYSLWILLLHGPIIKALTGYIFPNGITEFYRLTTLLLTLLIMLIFLLIFQTLKYLSKTKPA